MNIVNNFLISALIFSLGFPAMAMKRAYISSVESEASTQVGQPEQDAQTQLFYGATTGNLEIVKSSLIKGARVNGCNLDRFTALHLAIMYRQYKIVDYLLENNADIDVEMPGAGSAARWAHNTCNDNDQQIARLIRNKYSAKRDLAIAMDRAASEGNLELVKALHLQGAPLGRRFYHPLHTACSKGHLEIVEYLVEQGADFNQIDSTSSGDTPVNLAVQYGHDIIVKYLVGKKANIHLCKSGSHKSPLDSAIVARNKEIAKFLIDNGANINGSNVDPHNAGVPLRLAVTSGDLELAHLLLAHGANPNFVFSPEFMKSLSDSSKDVLEVAIRLNDAEMVELLLKYGADIQSHHRLAAGITEESACGDILHDWDTHFEILPDIVDSKGEKILRLLRSKRSKDCSRNRAHHILEINCCMVEQNQYPNEIMDVVLQTYSAIESEI